MFNAAQKTRTSVSLKRVLVLFGIVIGSITALGIVAAIGMAEWPLVTALAWHLHHGNKVTMQGHIFQVPLLYEPEISEGGRQIEMVEYPRLMSGSASVTLESTGKVLNQAAVDQWQSSLMNVIRPHANEFERSLPLMLHGRKLAFVCIDNDFTFGESLICHAVGTDITVSTNASKRYTKETRSVLETSN
jgi:hypothetical protein